MVGDGSGACGGWMRLVMMRTLLGKARNLYFGVFVTESALRDFGFDVEVCSLESLESIARLGVKILQIVGILLETLRYAQIIDPGVL